MRLTLQSAVCTTVRKHLAGRLFVACYFHFLSELPPTARIHSASFITLRTILELSLVFTCILGISVSPDRTPM